MIRVQAVPIAVVLRRSLFGRPERLAHATPPPYVVGSVRSRGGEEGGSNVLDRAPFPSGRTNPRSTRAERGLFINQSTQLQVTWYPHLRCVMPTVPGIQSYKSELRSRPSEIASCPRIPAQPIAP